MKLTKYLLASATAIAVTGALSLAHAQTTTPGTPGVGSDAKAVQQPQGAGTPSGSTMNNGTTATTTTMDRSTSGTAATGSTNSQGTTASRTLDNQGTATMNRRADGTMGSGTNRDGTGLSNERVARADRG